MKPIAVIGLILVAAVALRVSMQAGGNAVAASQPAPAFKVLSVSCDPNNGRPRAQVAVQNTGADLEYVKAYVTFGSQVYDGFLSPTNLPSGSIGTALIYANHGAAASCSLEAVQDGNGRAAVLSH